MPPASSRDASSGPVFDPVLLTDATTASERLALLDVLRGLALFGMILVHFHQQMRLEVTGLEDAIGWFVWMFVEQKAWGMFAFLFGVGFAVLLRRVEARGARVVPLYLRRLAALAVIGVVAEVGFGFSILFEYACWGLVLLFVRNWSTRTLVITAAVAICARWLIVEFVALHAWWTAMAPVPRTPFVPIDRSEVSYVALLGARWERFVAGLPLTWRSFVPDMNLALFVLGLLAVHQGVLADPKRHRRTIARWMMFGALSWALAWTAQLFLAPLLPAVMLTRIADPALRAFGFIDDQWLCLTYVGGVALLLAYRPWWTSRLRLFADAGRMALTNYMLQVVVLDVLASGYGFGLKLRPYAYVIAAVLMFSIQAAFSRVWLARYRFGPLEWLWRTVTYLRWQPLRRFVTDTASV